MTFTGKPHSAQSATGLGFRSDTPQATYPSKRDHLAALETTG
jgi:hypothetical protein